MYEASVGTAEGVDKVLASGDKVSLMLMDPLADETETVCNINISVDADTGAEVVKNVALVEHFTRKHGWEGENSLGTSEGSYVSSAISSVAWFFRSHKRK